MIIGITGRIATGKSTAAAILERKGFCLIDADFIYHQLRDSSDEMNNEIFNRFNSLDNKKILEIINDNKNALLELNSITHKYVISEIQRQIKEIKNKKIVLDVPVPVENGFLDIVDFIIVTTCSLQVQLSRIIKRDNCDEISALKKINIQMSDGNYCKLGDVIINTDNLTVPDLEVILENAFDLS